MVKLKSPNAVFSPAFTPDIGTVVIVFRGVRGICSILSINGTADLLNISKREKGICGDDIGPDASIRVAGTYVCHNDVDDSPCGILLCQGIHKRSFLD